MLGFKMYDDIKGEVIDDVETLTTIYSLYIKSLPKREFLIGR